jgi:hypothetical protein
MTDKTFIITVTETTQRCYEVEADTEAKAIEILEEFEDCAEEKAKELWNKAQENKLESIVSEDICFCHQEGMVKCALCQEQVGRHNAVYSSGNHVPIIR